MVTTRLIKASKQQQSFTSLGITYIGCTTTADTQVRLGEGLVVNCKICNHLILNQIYGLRLNLNLGLAYDFTVCMYLYMYVTEIHKYDFLV
jgi:hypothetical protein